MANTNTRWYRILADIPLADATVYLSHMENHLISIANIISHSYIPTSSFSGGDTIGLIVTVIMNGSKVTDDVAMAGLAAHLQTDHGYSVVVTVVQSDQVYP